MSIRNLLRDKGRPERKADNSPPSVSLLFRKCGTLDSMNINSHKTSKSRFAGVGNEWPIETHVETDNTRAFLHNVQYICP
jgi:hypothetical protein